MTMPPDEYKPDGTTFKIEDVQFDRRWVHYRGGSYRTARIVRWSSNGPDEGRDVVIYYSEEKQKWNARFADEFLDGRFRPVD